MSDSTQACRTCAEVLPLAGFSVHSNGRPKSECRRCNVLRAKLWREANPELSRQLNNEGRRRRRADPEYRRREQNRENARRRMTPESLRTETACGRCGQVFEYQRKRKPRTVCPPCRDADWAWWLYKLSAPALAAFYEAHGGRCGICGGAESPTQWGNRMVIDHNHATGELRGLLCSLCNTAIGLFADDPARLLAAAEYLKRFP